MNGHRLTRLGISVTVHLMAHHASDFDFGDIDFVDFGDSALNCRTTARASEPRLARYPDFGDSAFTMR